MATENDLYEMNVSQLVGNDEVEDEPPAEPAEQPLDGMDEKKSLVKTEVETNPSLEHLQTDEQRRVLDTVAQVRKCGLDSILSLPQLVVCGDQSSGKSSVLEALTEIPFPRSDNLCTRFATEIILRRADSDSLTIKIIPDEHRPSHEQSSIKRFSETISDFGELSRVMDAAKAIMDGGSKPGLPSASGAFARDVLSIEIEGPHRPQLTLVDIPGLIQTDTKGTTMDDVQMVAEITDHYVGQSRTICLAVVSGAYDYANQRILKKVREKDIDPKGKRTLGIITKPDLLPKGSGIEGAFLELARNQNIHLELDWHVLKNRRFEEGNCSLEERKSIEQTYFRTSNFNQLPSNHLGIDALRNRLSVLLFDHIKKELPRLSNDLEQALLSSQQQLSLLGDRRANPAECRGYFAQLSLDFYEVCKAAVNGHYEGSYFTSDIDPDFDLTMPGTVRRMRAVVQLMNTKFADNHRTNGRKYNIQMADLAGSSQDMPSEHKSSARSKSHASISPVAMDRDDALKWVKQALTRTRGKELVGNFNPLLIGELFWEQSSKWHRMGQDYLDEVAEMCMRFLDILLEDKCPNDVVTRLRVSLFQDSLKHRQENAVNELAKILEDVKNYPINYNHYYTDAIAKNRQGRQNKSLAQCIEHATSHEKLEGCHSIHTSASIDVDQVIARYSQMVDPDMENVSCEDALDCLAAIYKVQQKVFVANITTQVVERHLIRGLEKIFSPVAVATFSDAEVESMVSEPETAKSKRAFLEDRIEKLKEGRKILRAVVGRGSA